MQHWPHDYSLSSPHEHWQPPIALQPHHQPNGPACLVILPLWLETGGLCVFSVCLVCVCVCVCVCVYVCVCVCLVCVFSVCLVCV